MSKYAAKRKVTTIKQAIDSFLLSCRICYKFVFFSGEIL